MKNKESEYCDITSSSLVSDTVALRKKKKRGYFEELTAKISAKFNERYKFTDPSSSMKP